MTAKESRIEPIFYAALQMQTPDELAAYLHDACQEDESLRKRVEALLNARPKLGSFLQGQAAEMVITSVLPLETPGTQIGPYKLLQQIGEGGMGVVWMAEQLEPVCRRVALKVIKPGMDSRQVIARFESERQALAMMDHPSIARVLDAGTTQAGRPYFVMELVHGVPLTKFCQESRLTVRQRLELLIPVCHAIQHAHQKGIIHRDIKPNNVLVTMYDDKPVPKVIDFGVAKAIDQSLTERTLFTQFGTLVGTLEYMSPEQAEMNALGVDTRSDVYSLGVLLYELLTGTTPLDGASLREAAWQEMLRRIKEEEPASPSHRLSSSGTLKQFAAVCRAEPTQLMKMVHGELDWIVMKCLEKDRTRRYESPNAFARDLQRYLADEPVGACPPSTVYRLRKSARKHRWAIATAASFITLIVIGLVVSISLASAAMKARNEAVLAREASERALSNETTARAEAEQARERAELLVTQLQAATRLVNEGIGMRAIGQPVTAYQKFSEAIEAEPNYREAYIQRAKFYLTSGSWDLAAADFEQRFRMGNQADAITHFEHALLRMHSQDTTAHRLACLTFVETGHIDSPDHESRELLVRALALAPQPAIGSVRLAALGDSIIGPNRHPYDIYVSALAQLRAGNHAEAVVRFQLALKEGAKSSSGHRAGTAPLAIALFKLGRTMEAEEALGQADETLEKWTVAIAQSPLPRMPVDWKDWLEFRIYLREARMLIRQQGLETDPRLVDREQAALRHLTGADANDAPVKQAEQVADEPTPLAAAQSNPIAPRFWTDDEMKSVELPLANSKATPRHVAEEYYYQIPEMKLHRSYPVYHPDQEPPGHFEKLVTTAPEIIWDSEHRPRLESEADWIAAGSLIFEMPIGFGSGRILPSTETSLFVRDAKWYAENAIPTTREGVNPFFRYIIREPGKVEVGVLSCAMCHTRVTSDGTAVTGAQGNFPFGRVYATQMLERGAIPDAVRGLERNLFGAPWISPDPQESLWSAPLADLAAAHASIPPGVIARHRSSPHSPVVVPDLFGLQARNYLDRTGLQRHRGIQDLMRYAALNQGMDALSQFDDFIPAGKDFSTRPRPAAYFFGRYSNEQLYALAKYVYSLKPPANPHLLDELAESGRQVFMANGCARCHQPDKDYGSNLLVAAPGFEVPADHPEKSRVMSRRVNTDPTLTLSTRRGTGFYKVPSLRSVWLRGPFEHSGSVATLEDWFDSKRLEDDYVPTGWKGLPETKGRAVKGHPFGLQLRPDEKTALIAFLKAL
jgi:serine/threonine protein kinase/tetratricopeptide (TPR) repeat protein